MKIFLSYKYTGEDIKDLNITIKRICDSLEKAGHSVFCSFWKSDLFTKEKFTKKRILEYALDELDKSNCILSFVKSEEKSEGMLLEIGYALAKKKKYILAIRKDIETTFLREMANKVIEFSDLNELYKKLEGLKK